MRHAKLQHKISVLGVENLPHFVITSGCSRLVFEIMVFGNFRCSRDLEIVERYFSTWLNHIAGGGSTGPSILGVPRMVTYCINSNAECELGHAF